MTLGGRCFSERKRKEDAAAVFDYSEGCYWGEDADKPAVRSCLLVCLFVCLAGPPLSRSLLAVSVRPLSCIPEAGPPGVRS